MLLRSSFLRSVVVGSSKNLRIAPAFRPPHLMSRDLPTGPQLHLRSLASISKKATKKIPEDLLHYLHGRRGNERVDSVSSDMLKDRRMHQNRLALMDPQPEVIRFLEKSGFGSKKYRESFETIVASTEWDAAEHLTSASSNWPTFKHILPEIAIAGHSNCGKSTLVNVMSGFSHREGPASVSDRAGWTDQICFYQVGKRPPLLILADMPGYGHAVASTEDVQAWKTMTRDYLRNRKVVSRCLVLVDSTRGLCDQDKNMVRFLTKHQVPWQIILTKADLLSVEDLARCILLVENDLLSEFNIGSENLWSRDPEDVNFNKSRTIRRVYHRLVLPVSSNHGSGVFNLWREIKACAFRDTIEGRGGSIRSKADETKENSKISFKVEGRATNSAESNCEDDSIEINSRSNSTEVPADFKSPARAARAFVEKVKSAQSAANGSEGALKFLIRQRRASERKILAEVLTSAGLGAVDSFSSRFSSGMSSDDPQDNEDKVIDKSEEIVRDKVNDHSNNSKNSGSNNKKAISNIAGIADLNLDQLSSGSEMELGLSPEVTAKQNDSGSFESNKDKKKATKSKKKKIVDEDDFIETKKKETTALDKISNTDDQIEPEKLEEEEVDIDKVILDSSSAWGSKLMRMAGERTEAGDNYEDIFGVKFMKAAPSMVVREHFKAGVIRRESYLKKIQSSALKIKT